VKFRDFGCCDPWINVLRGGRVCRRRALLAKGLGKRPFAGLRGDAVRQDMGAAGALCRFTQPQPVSEGSTLYDERVWRILRGSTDDKATATSCHRIAN